MGLLARIRSDLTYIRELARIDRATKGVGPDSLYLLPDALEASIDRHGANLAFRFEGTDLDYAALEARANRFANWGLEQGFAAGDCVALFMENRPDFVAFWFGMSKIGVVTALINNQLTGTSLTHCVQIAHARALVMNAAQSALLDTAREDLGGNLPVWSLDGATGDQLDLDAALAQQSTERPPRKYRDTLRGRDVALYVYTSGTTGLPKAARMTHARCLDMMLAFISPCRIGPQDRVYETLPLYHGTCGVCGVGTALLAGAGIVLRRRFSASRFWSEARENGATVFVYVGELGRYLMNNPPSPDERDHSITRAFGNGMRRDVWAQFSERTGITGIVEFYGSTEGNVSLINVDHTIGAIGRIPPLMRRFMQTRLLRVDPQTQETVRDENGFCIETEAGEPGEAVGRIIAEKSRWRFEGYNDRAATEKKILRDVFEPGDAWFRTGDLLMRDKDHYFYFIDRIGDTFRWKSENVSTGEVAEVLQACPGILTANVYGVEVPGHDGRAGMAALTVDEGFDPAIVHAEAVRNLPVYARPVFLRIKQEDDTTGTLKFRKVDLVAEGLDPKAIADRLYVLAEDRSGYHILDTAWHDAIVAGDYRL